MRASIVAAIGCFVAAPVLSVLPGAAEPAGAPVPASSARGLTEYAAASDDVEDFAAYVPQTSCHPRWRKGISRFRDLVMTTYPQTKDWGSLRNCTDDGISEHLDGRAWDWHADVEDPAAFAAATDLLNWLMADGPEGEHAYWARRLGIMYIIYNHRIWGSYRASDGWRRLGEADPHTDHVHFSFSWAGAFGKTSFWDATAAAEDYGPCRPYQGEPAALHARNRPNRAPCHYPPRLTLSSGASGALLWQGSRSKEVLAVQQALGVPGAEGFFGPATRRAVVGYQQGRGLPTSGAVDRATRAALVSDGVLSR